MFSFWLGRRKVVQRLLNSHYGEGNSFKLTSFLSIIKPALCVTKKYIILVQIFQDMISCPDMICDIRCGVVTLWASSWRPQNQLGRCMQCKCSIEDKTQGVNIYKKYQTMLGNTYNTCIWLPSLFFNWTGSFRVTLRIFNHLIWWWSHVNSCEKR